MHERQDDRAAASLSGTEHDDCGPAPWFPASYGGECSGCFAGIEIGDIIRADGEGGWERQECCGDD